MLKHRRLVGEARERRVGLDERRSDARSVLDCGVRASYPPGPVLPTSLRLLRLLTLLQGRRFWSGAELAESLEVTERTVRRDIDRLRDLGYPVHAASGVAGGYQLGAGSELPPLVFEDDEVLAVALGLRVMTAGTLKGMEEASVRALTKLEQVLPARLKRRMKAIFASVVALNLAGPSVDAGLVSVLAAACRNSDLLTFGYEDRTKAASLRTVEPHSVVHTGARWYLVAWDRNREDWRTFRVDRIQPPISKAGTFITRTLPDRDLAAYVSRSLTTAPYAHRARFLLHVGLEEAKQRIPPLVGRLEPVDDAHCVLEAGAQNLEMLPLYVAGFGVDFEVLEPPELASRMEELAERLMRAARTKVPSPKTRGKASR